MAKTITSGLETHLAQEVTTLATLWRVTRTDGEVFYFTDHDVNIVFEGNTYVASVGYDRTSVANQVGLSVDNLDVQGFFDSSAVTDQELRAGLFDFAQVHVMLVNFEDLTQGVLKLRRGRFGEVIYSDSGVFKTELRGLTQAYSQRIGELFSSECRTDLGSSRCKVPVIPSIVLRDTAYVVGDTVRASALLENIPLATLMVPGDEDANDTSNNGATGTLGTQAEIQSLVSMFGGGAVEFSPSGSVDPSQAFLSFPDNAAYVIGTGEFTIEGWVRFKNLTDTTQTIASQYTATGDNRSWLLWLNGTNLEFRAYADGITPTTVVTGVWSPVIDTWYHVAVTRDASDNVRLFIDGTQVATALYATAIIDVASPIFLGKIRQNGGDDNPLNGFIDDFRFVNGYAVYTSGFTPPAAALVSNPANLHSTLITEDFDDRMYVCTVAGTTALVQPTYNTTVTNTTVDGTATFEAQEAWTRAAEVASVTDRRIFSIIVTESRAVDDWFNYGAVIWDSGNNVGLAMEVKDWVQSGSVVTLFLTMPFPIQVGDKLGIYAGCDKRSATCIAKFDNIVNFRGEQFIPGPDSYYSIKTRTGSRGGGGGKF